ncbi:MAG: response regulator [Myxococcales bacterium FL481]|nr:MAG: response regulator [Myxococcales bacterium FL481]
MGDKPRLLCVDDQRALLGGMKVTLRKEFTVVGVDNGAEALETLRRDGPFAAILCDMRMPGMDGTAVLSKAKEIAPDTTRLLLTGFADTESAVAVVNKGGVFRFLTKPCPPPELRQACLEAVAEYNKRLDERQVLETTVKGCIETVVQVLALASPLAFGRAERLKASASALAQRVCPQIQWEVEVAAMLSHAAYVTFPVELLEKLHRAEPLDSNERARVARAPATSAQLLVAIPRLEAVREIIASVPGCSCVEVPVAEELSMGARILRVAIALDEAETAQLSADACIDALAASPQLDPEVVAAVDRDFFVGRSPMHTRNVRVGELEVGMYLAADLRTRKGVMLMARGQRITVGMLERLDHISHADIQEPILVTSGHERDAA